MHRDKAAIGISPEHCADLEITNRSRMEDRHGFLGGMGLKSFQEVGGGGKRLGGDGVEGRCGRGGPAAQQEDVVPTARQVVGQVGAESTGGVIGQPTHRIQRFHGRACRHDAAHGQ